MATFNAAHLDFLQPSPVGLPGWALTGSQ